MKIWSKERKKEREYDERKARKKIKMRIWSNVKKEGKKREFVWKKIERQYDQKKERKNTEKRISKEGEYDQSKECKKKEREYDKKKERKKENRLNMWVRNYNNERKHKYMTSCKKVRMKEMKVCKNEWTNKWVNEQEYDQM